MNTSVNQNNNENGEDIQGMGVNVRYQTNYMQSSRRIDDDELSDDNLNEDFNYAWDDAFFNKFDWLKEKEAKKREKEQYSELSIDKLKLKAELLKEICKLLENELIDMKKEPCITQNKDENRLYLYFISLENEKMFLHTDFKKDYDVVLRECAEKFDFVKLHAPRKVVYTMIVDDLYDIDKHVKMFMHMFGVDDTRGGSYCNIELPDYLKQAIEHERPVTSIDYYHL